MKNEETPPTSFYILHFRFFTFGAASIDRMSGRWRVVALFRAGSHIGLIHANDDTPPGAVAFGVTRGVADCVLARELLGDLSVDVGELANLTREKHPAAGLLRELPQHEIRLVEASWPLEIA